MTILPLWKIKRELLRLKMQISQWPWFAFGGLRRAYYDKFEQHKVHHTQGDRPVADDLAIILIYQPQGILDSLLFQLEYLISKGIAPIVVSNVPISLQDKGLLKPLCHLIIERPNYGYDFGGYREGVLTVLKRSYAPQNLFILNDSIWFPLNKNCSLIDSARANTSELFGIFNNDHINAKDRRHLQSYFYRFKGSAVASKAFAQYWRKLTMTNNKHMVVRQCEMKLSRWFEKQGMAFDCQFDLTALFAATKQLSDAEMLDYLKYIRSVSTRTQALTEPYQNHTSLTPRERTEIDTHLTLGNLGRYFLIAHPLTLLRDMKSPTLKKDKQPMYAIQRRELFKYGLETYLDERIRSEMSTWDTPKT